MNAYEVFASVYDELMDNIPYDDWCAYIIQVLQKYRVTDGLVCELGCGTGEVTERLADAREGAAQSGCGVQGLHH